MTDGSLVLSLSVRRRTWGFRFSVLDGVVLLVTAPATWFAWPSIGEMAASIPMAVGHFFLFCNVFRIHRTKELVWAAVCLVNVGGWAIADDVWWLGILAVQTPLTVLLIVIEMRQPWYHGVLARRLNPRLADYLEHRL